MALWGYLSLSLYPSLMCVYVSFPCFLLCFCLVGCCCVYVLPRVGSLSLSSLTQFTHTHTHTQEEERERSDATFDLRWPVDYGSSGGILRERPARGGRPHHRWSKCICCYNTNVYVYMYVYIYYKRKKFMARDTYSRWARRPPSERGCQQRPSAQSGERWGHAHRTGNPHRCGQRQAAPLCWRLSSPCLSPPDIRTVAEERSRLETNTRLIDWDQGWLIGWLKSMRPCLFFGCRPPGEQGRTCALQKLLHLCFCGVVCDLIVDPSHQLLASEARQIFLLGLHSACCCSIILDLYRGFVVVVILRRCQDNNNNKQLQPKTQHNGRLHSIVCIVCSVGGQNRNTTCGGCCVCSPAPAGS